MQWGGNSHYQKAEFTEVSAPERLVWLHSNTDADWNAAPSPMMPNWPPFLLTRSRLRSRAVRRRCA